MLTIMPSVSSLSSEVSIVEDKDLSGYQNNLCRDSRGRKGHKIECIMKLTGYDSVCSWGVAVACSFVTCMSVLPLRVSGMLFAAFLSRYNADRQSASLFIVVHLVFASCSSPLIGYLGEIFELRNLILLGCFLNSLGVGICFFAENIIIVTISIGFLCGIGLDLQVLLLPQIIKQHFTKNLSRAYGITWVGSSVGTFVVIPMFQLLLNIYGVSGALLITCAIMFHSIPMTLLLRNPKYKKTPISLCDKQPLEKEQIIFKKTIKEKGIFVNSDHCKGVLTNNIDTKNNEMCVEIKPCVTLNANITEETETGDTYQNTVSCHEPSTEGHRHPNANTLFQSSISKGNHIEIHQNYKQTNSKEATNSPLCDHSQRTEKRNKYMKALKTLAIFRNPPFLVIMLSMSTYAYMDVFVSTIIIDVSRDKGIPQNQQYFLLMLLCIAKIVGFTCSGWITDKGYLTASKFLAISFLCLGLSCCGFTFSNSLTTMMISFACFGLCVSILVSGSPSLVYEFVEEEKQSMATTSRFLLNAPLSFTMGPILSPLTGYVAEIIEIRIIIIIGCIFSALGVGLCYLAEDITTVTVCVGLIFGYFRGTLGSYDGVFYFLTAVSMGCAVLLLLLPQLKRCNQSESHSSMDLKNREF